MKQDILLCVLSVIGIISLIIYLVLSTWENHADSQTKNTKSGLRISSYFQRVMGHYAASSALFGCGATAAMFYKAHVSSWIVLDIVLLGCFMLNRSYKRFALASSIIALGGDAKAMQVHAQKIAQLNRSAKLNRPK